MYTSELPQAARDLVDNVQNCDDLLFNYMLANATGSGPIRELPAELIRAEES